MIRFVVEKEGQWWVACYLEKIFVRVPSGENSEAIMRKHLKEKPTHGNVARCPSGGNYRTLGFREVGVDQFIKK